MLATKIRKGLNYQGPYFKLSSFTIRALLTAGGTERAAISIGKQQVSQVRRLFCNAFVTAAPVPFASSKKHPSDSSHINMLSSKDTQSECEITPDRYSERCRHSKDHGLWMYHVESTTSTMDEAKFLVETKFIDKANEVCDSNIDNSSETDSPKSFIISATSQSNGRGTSKRNWNSAQIGNALFTIGLQQSAWMDELKARNDGRMVPLTLLPLKVGSVVASRVQQFLMKCTGSDSTIPKVTVKWPNDVLLQNIDSQSANATHEKVAGILIESSQDWFLIGIGVNVGYAPEILSEGVDYGRKATALYKYCSSDVLNNNMFYIETSKQLGRDIAHDIHTWLYYALPTSSSQIGDTILNEWKSFVDWEMELILRDTAKREKVKLKQVLDDGRVVVEEVETGMTRTLVSDYFL
jgi:biotin-(acetyl-CoA carboxylase) ligase